MFPWGSEWHGRLEQRTVESAVLRENPLGDPHVRPVYVYVPPGYDEEPERRYPAVYVLQSLTGQVDMWLARERWGGRTYPEAADAVFASGEVPPCLVVFVDAWTRYGGSQFVDSPAVGRYHTYLCDEVVPWVDSEYRTLATPERRAVQGHSSGGYGAMITPMLRPDLFRSLAAHAGDALFELCFLPSFGAAARTLARDYEGSPDRFWADFWSRRPHGRPGDGPVLAVLCTAACFSPTGDGTYELPFDLPTGRLRDDVWERWLEWDPVRMAPRYAEALRGLRAAYLDAGAADEFCLDLGTIAFRDELAAAGTQEIFFELHPGGHGGSDHRYPLGLRYLAERIGAGVS